MPAFDLIYVTKARALESGLTHEGTLFGVPAWFDGDSDSGAATPKLPVLHLWCIFADFCYEIASWFIPEDGVLVSPITVTGRIQ